MTLNLWAQTTMGKIGGSAIIIKWNYMWVD